MIKNGFKIFAGVLITILLSVVMSLPAAASTRNGFDELHINENYRQNVWHPENRGSRMNGFDEFHYPDEL